MKKNLSHRDVIPIEIGSYLQDTAHLDATKSGAYLHLIFHYWNYGPLPDDDECLASVAKLPIDPWRIIRKTVMAFFKLGEDGLWHQAGTDRRRDVALAKRKKRHNASVIANQIRWARYREMKGGENLGESLDPNRIQSDKSDPPCRFPSQVSSHALLPNNPPNPPEIQPHRDNARAHAVNVGLTPGQEPQLDQTAPETDKNSDQKRNEGENAIRPLQRAAGTRVIGNILPKSPRGKKAARISTSEASRKLLDPPFSDLRFEAFRAEIFRYWQGQNPGDDSVPWMHPESVALASYLIEFPTLDLAGFKERLRNRAASEVNPRSRPSRWIRDLEDFAAGPLDRYKQLKKGPRIL